MFSYFSCSFFLIKKNQKIKKIPTKAFALRRHPPHPDFQGQPALSFISIKNIVELERQKKKKEFHKICLSTFHILYIAFLVSKGVAFDQFQDEGFAVEICI